MRGSPLSAGAGAESTDCDSPTTSPPLHPHPPLTSTTSSSDEPPSLCQRLNPLNLPRFIKRRTVEHYRNLSVSEFSGSLGDLGTFIPLTVALARERRIALAPALFWAGFSNLVTGYAWDVPMCVQPMKSIAAVALTDVAAGTSASGGASSTGLDAQSVTTAGILTGGAVLLLGVTNLMEVVNWIVPLTVVSGLQVGVGLRLASKGMRDISQLGWGGGYDCIALAVACALLSMFWLRENESGAKKNLQSDSNGDGSGAAAAGGTIADSVTNSCDDGDNMEMGRVENANQLETAAALLQQPTSACSATPRTACESAPSNSLAEPSSPPSSSSRLGILMKRACCFLDPSPKTPHPVGIYLFLVGCLFAAITLATAGPDSGYDLPLQFFGAPIAINALEGVTLLNWRQGFLQGTLPQLPLTALNSVISVCCLAHSLYPEKRNPELVRRNRTDSVVTRREVSVSVGLMNLVLCPLGSMPNCHGAGGLAGQHRFGARHGTSVAILGLAKMLLAVFFGASALTMLDALPVAVLGIMIVIAGLELVGTGVGMLFEMIQTETEKARGDANGTASNSKAILRKNALISTVTAGVIVALQKTHYGALSGWVVHMVYGDGCKLFLGWLRKRRQKRRGSNDEP